MITPVKIVLASLNQGKLLEFQQRFADADLADSKLYMELIPQNQFTQEAAEETGLSFIENAIIKARFAAKCANLPALADDSGLCVTALYGEPGIYSARYAEQTYGGKNQTQNNINKLLYRLKDVAENQRQASFCCALAFVRNANDPLPLIVQAIWNGKILTQSQGVEGFGYDPVFQPDGYSCSAAELSMVEKNRISHRGKAIKKFITALRCSSKQNLSFSS